MMETAGASHANGAASAEADFFMREAMRSLLARPCLEPGCPRAARSGPRCDQHQAAADRAKDWRRGTSAQRGYGSRWRRSSAAVIARDDGICYLCGQPGADTADHLLPKARGGSDDPDNLAAAHRRCNSKKGLG